MPGAYRKYELAWRKNAATHICDAQECQNICFVLWLLGRSCEETVPSLSQTVAAMERPQCTQAAQDGFIFR